MSKMTITREGFKPVTAYVWIDFDGDVFCHADKSTLHSVIVGKAEPAVKIYKAGDKFVTHGGKAFMIVKDATSGYRFLNLNNGYLDGFLYDTITSENIDSILGTRNWKEVKDD